MRYANVRTIAEAVEVCRQRLRGVSPTPWLDARLLAQFVTGLDASAVVAYGDARLDDRAAQRLFALVARRAQGEPIAYIVGRTWFCGLEIAVDRRVLVPRPETEDLVALVVKRLARRPEVRVVDIGTGSGAIACALAHFAPQASIAACDLSSDALELAAHNVARLGLSEQVRLVQGDLFDAFAPGQRFDVAVANLPYVAQTRLDLVEAAVLEHEPHVALLGGPDGLNVYRRLLAQAPDRLTADGVLYMECSPLHAQTLVSLAGQVFPGWHCSLHRDAAGLERIVACESPSGAFGTADGAPQG
jgi:release factor glutamine methyltransferase